MRLRVLPGAYAVCRLDPAQHLPPAPAAAAFWSLTKAGDEWSLVCADGDAPQDTDAIVSPGWRILAVEGPLDLGLTGVLASLAGTLATADVPIFPLATHDTDWILVPGDRLDVAVAALRGDGHVVD